MISLAVTETREIQGTKNNSTIETECTFKYTEVKQKLKMSVKERQQELCLCETTVQIIQQQRST